MIMPVINEETDRKRLVVEKAKQITTLSLHSYEVGSAYDLFAKEKEKMVSTTYVKTLKTLLGLSRA